MSVIVAIIGFVVSIGALFISWLEVEAEEEE